MDVVELSAEPLVLERYITAVSDDGAGAISTFIGVTRDTFDGKKVVRLEYEAYNEMALQELHGVVARMRERWQLKKVAVAHRTGVVPVGQASVIITVSSAHRADALEATRFAIDDLKATVPIWKKEHYETGAEWKANAAV